ncbi:MAG: N-acetylglucosamine-6-phosphate deacetylase [Clostridia bacterium]|nr:N-acetylglucosamine-6-phosphate deacetylase [Clostridia bacterium]
MITRIKNGRVILRDGVVENIYIYMEDGLITAVTGDEKPFDAEIDAAGRYVSPGFVEIHTHGGGGADFLDGTVEAFLTAAELHARHGVTTLVPTATSGNMEDTFALNDAFEEAAANNPKGADMPGLHLEGPYFAYGQRGAQDPRHLRNPEPGEYNQILDRCPKILRWSVAPELPGAFELGAELKKRGILAAIGHSDAGYAEVEAAWNAGYTHVTHLYSGMSVLHRRNAYRYVGVLESAYLIDDMTVEIIADGCHLPAELLKFVYKFKGPEKTALITDSMRGAGMPDGPSMLGHWKNGLETIIEDGVAKLPDRTSFAGSVATFDRLVRNMLNMAQVPLHEVITMACRTPAKIMGFTDRGELREGLRADVILFDEDIRVSHVIVGGCTIYQEDNE